MEWIEITNVLPKSNGDLLVVINSDITSGMSYIDILFFDKRNSKFLFRNGTEWTDMTSQVSHWMHLPEKPINKEND